MTTQLDRMDADSDSSTSDPLDMRGEEGWEDLEDDEIPETFVSLFDDKTFPSASEMFRYCKTEYNFDIWQLQRLYNLDFLGLVKLVNYVRKNVQQGQKSPDTASKSLFEDEFFLLPVMEDDAVLHNLEEILQDAREASVNEVEELRDQLSQLQAQFNAYRGDVQQYLNNKLESDLGDSTNSKTTTNGLIATDKTPADQADLDYFHSYSYNSIHESMLKDKVRTDAYRDFIYDNKDLFSGKIVLDVGCGTGILSMFCAKAGAKKVYAVDNSAIINQARTIIYNNGLSDKIECFRGRIEDIQLPVEKVDIIVSEWMGYCLLYESMLDSVLFARNKYLAPGGLMVPSHATIQTAPLGDSDLRISHIDFWNDVYGFDMRSMAEKAEYETLIRTVDENELAGGSCSILDLDLHQITPEALQIDSTFILTANKTVELLEGFVIWFDIYFSRSSEPDQSQENLSAMAKEKAIVAFSTGPSSQPTHWQQGVCLIKDPSDHLANGESITGQVKFKKRDDHARSLDIHIEWEASSSPRRSQDWIVD